MKRTHLWSARDLKFPWWYFALANWRLLAWFLKILCWTVNLKILKSRKTKAATYALSEKSFAGLENLVWLSLFMLHHPNYFGETVKNSLYLPLFDHLPWSFYCGIQSSPVIFISTANCQPANCRKFSALSNNFPDFWTQRISLADKVLYIWCPL